MRYYLKGGNDMKKCLAWILCLVMLLSFCGCSLISKNMTDKVLDDAKDAIDNMEFESEE